MHPELKHYARRDEAARDVYMDWCLETGSKYQRKGRRQSFTHSSYRGSCSGYFTDGPFFRHHSKSGASIDWVGYCYTELENNIRHIRSKLAGIDYEARPEYPYYTPRRPVVSPVVLGIYKSIYINDL